MNKYIALSFIALSLVISGSIIGCKRNSVNPEFTLDVKQDVFKSNYNTVSSSSTFKDRGVTYINSNLAAVGRLLFYDSRLSVSGNTSCATCHMQSKNFSDGKAFSTGFMNGTTKRNSMAISNAEEKSENKTHIPSYFWDGRAASLFDLSLMPAKNHLEMGMDNGTNIVSSISNIGIYKDAFNKIGYSITEASISSCIAEFLKSLQAYNTRYDAGLTAANIKPDFIGSTNFSNFSPSENRGKFLFYDKFKCVTCHGFTSQMPMGEDQSTGYGNKVNTNEALAMNVGLDPNGGSADPANRFKPPTLRNIAYSAPYMHDGRFKTLEDVVEHYSSGIFFNQFLAPELRAFSFGGPRGMNMTDGEKKDLVAFLQTLSDEGFLSDKRFSNPFKP